MSIQLCRTVKNMIRHQDIKQLSKPQNIFQDCTLNKTFCNSFKSSYDIVGDRDFKKKFNVSKDYTPVNQENQKEQDTLEQTKFNTTYCNQTRCVDDGTLAYKLSKEKQLQISRNRRTFFQLQKIKDRDERINNHLKKRLSYFGTRQVKNTITFQKQQIQSHPNPQLIDLINDNIPQYWKNSLRDNEKRLKRHIKGNTFKKQIAQQMLQTLKGRQKLTSSIPRIKEEFLSPKCSRDQFMISKRKRFSVKGSPALKKSQTSFQTSKNKTASSIPYMKFQQVYKINYDSSYRWMASELC